MLLPLYRSLGPLGTGRAVAVLGESDGVQDIFGNDILDIFGNPILPIPKAEAAPLEDGDHNQILDINDNPILPI